MHLLGCSSNSSTVRFFSTIFPVVRGSASLVFLDLEIASPQVTRTLRSSPFSCYLIIETTWLLVARRSNLWRSPHPHACLSFLPPFPCFLLHPARLFNCIKYRSVHKATPPSLHCITPFPVWSSPFVPIILRFRLMKLLRHARISHLLELYRFAFWEPWRTFCSWIHSWRIFRLFSSFLRLSPSFMSIALCARTTVFPTISISSTSRYRTIQHRWLKC
jgi:hypothetical protein